VRYLVTGAAGFIGSHLAARLVEEGHHVVGLDNLLDGSIRNVEAVPGMDFVEGDLRDEGLVRKVAAGCGVIFHQGAVRSVPRSVEFPGLTTDSNVRGTLNVLLAARDTSGRVVFASSSSVYGNQDRYPLQEGMDPRPRSPYAASKLAGEVYCQTWWRTFDLPTISLRYFNVYGPGQDPQNEYATVVPRFIKAALSGNRPTVHGDGEQARDFTFIDDVIDGNLLAAAAGRRAWGKVVNIAGGQRPTSINELLRIVGELTGTNPDPIRVAPREGDVRLTEGDVSLAGQLLGYRPQVSIREGLRRTVEWFGSPKGAAAFQET
jgi:nucleoside-diphosphate-sugar epimerase